MLRRIRYFQAVVECGNFRDAARRCFVSQSAISQQVSNLEKELGAKLIERHNRTFTLTEAGAFFYRKSLFIVSSVQQLISETRRLDAPQRPALRIGWNRSYLGEELSRAVGIFAERNPQADISSVSGSHESLYALLREDELDLVLNDQRRAFSSEYHNLVLGYGRMHIEVSERSPLCRLASVSPGELAGQPCVLIAEPHEQAAERLFFDLSLGLRAEYQFVRTLSEARLRVAAGQAFFPLDVVGETPPARQSIRRIPVVRSGEPIRRAYCAFWKKERDNPLAAAFAEVLRGCFA